MQKQNSTKKWPKRDTVKERRDEDRALTEKKEEELVDLLTPFFGCAPPFSYTVGMRCTGRGLLPGHLLSCLDVLEFLSFTVLAAQKAQRKYGVRASVLLSMALDEFAFDVRSLARDSALCSDKGDVKRISPKIARWFLARAKHLATAKAFRKALQCHSTRGYIEQICERGFGTSMKAVDLWSNIESYELEACDLAGMLPIGEYLNWDFEQVTDGAGNLIGLKPSPYRDLLRKETGAEAAAIIYLTEYAFCSILKSWNTQLRPYSKRFNTLPIPRTVGSSWFSCAGRMGFRSVLIAAQPN
jgi:hypothetical protein